MSSGSVNNICETPWFLWIYKTHNEWEINFIINGDFKETQKWHTIIINVVHMTIQNFGVSKMFYIVFLKKSLMLTKAFIWSEIQ